MRDILRRQQLHEAWTTVLEHLDWAGRLRSDLSALRGGPRLGVLWSEVARRFERGLDVSSEVALYLEPSAEFVAARTRRLQAEGRSFPHRRVDEWLVRSPQPKAAGLNEVCQRTGVGRVINLRQECEDSRELCRELGLDYVWLPVVDMGVPERGQLAEFLELFRQPVVSLVHCYAGQGRTGLFVACYRIHRGMEVEEAIRRSDGEANSRGMRPNQRDWVRQWALTGRG